jgi:twitching motility protein PilT
VRIDGRLRKLQAPVLTPADTEHMVTEVLRADLVREFATTNEADFAYAIPGVGRFRVNAFRARPQPREASSHRGHVRACRCG